jgi:hypothetical protein
MDPTTGVICLMCGQGNIRELVIPVYFCHYHDLVSRVAPESYTLQYVEVIQRHHKRTPYASNTFFKEDVEWGCVGSGPTFGATTYVFCFARNMHEHLNDT